MKNLKVHLFTIILIFHSIIMIAQDSNVSKSSIQIDYGISKTLHYNQPIVICKEGCFVIDQKSRFAKNINLSFYRLLGKKNKLKFGLGYSEYRFWEKGLTSLGGDITFPYETTRELYYFNFSIGFKHNFSTNKIIDPFVESELILEFFPEERSGLVNKSIIGTSIKISENWNLIIGTFVKTGLIKYNVFHKNYVPFGYGLQVGLNIIKL